MLKVFLYYWMCASCLNVLFWLDFVLFHKIFPLKWKNKNVTLSLLVAKWIIEWCKKAQFCLKDIYYCFVCTYKFTILHSRAANVTADLKKIYIYNTLPSTIIWSYQSFTVIRKTDFKCYFGIINIFKKLLYLFKEFPFQMWLLFWLFLESKQEIIYSLAIPAAIMSDKKKKKLIKY